MRFISSKTEFFLIVRLVYQLLQSGTRLELFDFTYSSAETKGMNLRLSLLTLNGPQKGQRVPLYQGQVFHGSAYSDADMLENHAIINIDTNLMWSVRTDGPDGQQLNRNAKIRIGSAETERISLIPGVIFHLGQTGFKVVEIPINKDFDAPNETLMWLEQQNWQQRKPTVFFFLLPLRLTFIKGPQAGDHYTLSYGPRILGFNQTDLNLLEPGLPKEAIHFTIDNLRPKIKKGSDYKVLVNNEDLSEHFLNDGDIIKIGTNEIEVSILK
jgi:hypothetical protein